MAHQRQERPSVVDGIIRKVSGLDKLADLSGDDLVRFSDDFGMELKESKVTTSQMRKIFSEIKHIHREAQSTKRFNIDRVKMLKPKIAYLAGREDKLKPFKRVMDTFIDKVGDGEDFARLASFMEAVMAYHKYHGGRD